MTCQWLSPRIEDHAVCGPRSSGGHPASSSDCPARSPRVHPWECHIEINRDFYDTRHNDGSTLLFCDGHAKWRKKASLLVSEFGLKPKAADEAVIRLTPQDRREVAF
jgi:prepilin-type processing-associated H-X9-DG protein